MTDLVLYPATGVPIPVDPHTGGVKSLTANITARGIDTIEIGQLSAPLARQMISQDWTVAQVIHDGLEAAGYVRSSGDGIYYVQGFRAELGRQIIEPDSGQTHWVSTGPAETVAKAAIARAFPAWAVSASTGAGPTTTVQARYHTVEETIGDAIRESGLVWRFGWDATANRVSVTTSPMPPDGAVFNADDAAVEVAEITTQRATTNRVVVLGQGEGTARTVRVYTRPILGGEPPMTLALESSDTDDETTHAARAAEKLREGAPQRDVTLELVNTPSFRLGVGWQLGKSVTVHTDDGTITAIIETAKIKLSPTGKVIATPIVGDKKPILGRVL